MPRAKNSSIVDNTNKRRETTPFDWHGFVSCDLSQSDKEAYANWLFSLKDSPITVLVQEVSELALKLSIAFDPEQGTWTAMLTGTKSSPLAYRGWGLTGRSNTPEQAFSVLAYKHIVMLNRMWSTELPDRKTGNDWVS